MILELKNIKGGYRKGIDILKGIDLGVNKGEIVAVIGKNGTGKSTLAKAIFNILPYRKGNVFFNGKDISRLQPKELIDTGMVYFMQGGRVFPELTIQENIILAAGEKDTNNLFDLFPHLQKHWHDEAGLLSGGERHQLALAMALVKQPRLLILDEPSAGLSPVATKELYQVLDKIKQEIDITIILIEQNIGQAVDFSERLLILEQGKILSDTKIEDKQKIINKIKDVYF